MISQVNSNFKFDNIFCVFKGEKESFYISFGSFVSNFKKRLSAVSNGRYRGILKQVHILMRISLRQIKVSSSFYTEIYEKKCRIGKEILDIAFRVKLTNGITHKYILIKIANTKHLFEIKY